MRWTNIYSGKPGTFIQNHTPVSNKWYRWPIRRSIEIRSGAILLEPSLISSLYYTADFGHSGPRLAIASCGHSGNYTLRHWIRSHDRAQYGSCTLGPVWQLPVWIRMAPHIGTRHSGHSWQLSLGPRVAATWLFMVIITFFIFYTKMRRLDGSMWFLLFLAPLC